MQNSLAALFPIASVTEVMTSAPPADIGDASFTDAFVDGDVPSEPLTRPEDTVNVALVAPFAWGGLLMAAPDAAPVPDLEGSPSSGPLSTEGMAVDGQVAFLSADQPVASDSSVLQPVRTIPAASLSSLSDGASTSMPTNQAGLNPGLRVSEENRAGPAAFPASSSRLKSVPPVLEAPKPAPATEAEPASIPPESSLTKGLGAENRAAALDGKHPWNAVSAVVGPEGQQTPRSGAVRHQGLPDVAIENGKGLANRSVAGDATVPTANAGLPQTDAFVGDLAVVSAAEPLQDPQPLQTLSGQDLGDPAALSVVAPGAAPILAGLDQDPHSFDLPSALTQGQDTDRGPHPVSFWERFFSDRSTPQAGSSLQSVNPQVMGVPFQGAASIEAVSNAPSDQEREVASGDETHAKNPGPDLPPGLTLSAAVAWSREMLSDMLSKALPQMVFSDWQGDLSIPEPRPEASLSALPVHSAGPTHGPSGAPAVGPQVPIPHIASQLAGVLVRNQSGMTELALAPEELGKVRLRMEPDSANPDRIVILISVERAETLELFRRHAGDLAEAIRSAGYSGADIGFGQNSQDGGSRHRKDSASAGPGIPFEEIGPVETSRMHSLGASLDLRL